MLARVDTLRRVVRDLPSDCQRVSDDPPCHAPLRTVVKKGGSPINTPSGHFWCATSLVTSASRCRSATSTRSASNWAMHWMAAIRSDPCIGDRIRALTEKADAALDAGTGAVVQRAA